MKIFSSLLFSVLIFNSIYPQDINYQFNDDRVVVRPSYQRTDNTFLQNYSPNDKEKYFPLNPFNTVTGVWTELNPKVPRVDYIGVDFVNPDTGWAVGLYGAVIKTKDGGTNWQTIETPTGEILTKVHSYNGHVVIIVGHNGTILRSSDGGNSFTSLTGITTQELWGVRMLNDTLGWICGRNQTLFKTTDAGLTWQNILTGYNYHYWSFDFLDNNHFMIACSQGKVLKTSNGGINWIIYQAGNTEDLFTIDIIDSLHIAAAGSFGKNVYSSDGGNTWTENQHTSLSINWIQYINKDTGYIIIGTISSFYKTTNRGQSWFNPGFNGTGEWQFEILNENLGYGVGAGLKVTKTENGFLTGRNLFLNKNWSDVFFINETKGFLSSAALGEKLYKTADGGNTITLIQNSPEWNYDILFLDSLIGFVGTNTIYKTTDGGENWFATNGAGQTTKMFFINSFIGWAIGGNNIYKTTDGGENWVVQFSHITDSFTSIFFVDSLNGWVTSRYIWQTTNGGQNWIQRTDIPAFLSNDIYFIDSVGFIIEFLKFYKTTNSGNNWFIQLNSQYIIRSFGWLDSQRGFIIGDGIYETKDKGASWEELIGLRNVGLRKFHAPLDYLGYSVGNQGLVYKYIDSSYIPVELLYFTGFYDNEKVTLEWETATEINNSGFELQKSKDKENWQSIGFVRGSGSSTEHNNYKCIDNASLNEKNYYRLKQIDFNGSYEYSDIIAVSVPLSNFKLYQNFPNPFNPITTIKYVVPHKSIVRISLYDIKGEKIVDLINEEKESGIYSIEFNSKILSSGVYLYRMTSSDGYNLSKKLIILK